MKIEDEIRTIEEARGLVLAGAHALVNHMDENGLRTKLLGPDSRGGLRLARLCSNELIKELIKDGLLKLSYPSAEIGDCFKEKFLARYDRNSKDE